MRPLENHTATTVGTPARTIRDTRKRVITLRNKLIQVAVLGAALLTAACGSLSSTAGAISYAPAAYGQNGDCYYINSPAEAVALEQAGLCPRSWVPVLMPLAWHEEYYSYYDSPSYYDTYVPARYRTVYVTRQRGFYRSYHARITTLSRSAVYKTSAGGTIKGTTITSRTRFGSGTSFGSAGQQYGGGTARKNSTSSIRTSAGTSRTSTSHISTGVSHRYGGGSSRGGRG